MSYGKLFGVGLGPGAPDLITVRALRLLRQVPVIALPRSADGAPSRAWKILQPTLGTVPGQEKLFLTFPMKKHPHRFKSAWDEAFKAIGHFLERKLDVAFATQGDPSVFSTFIYLAEEAPKRWPGIHIEVIPGVTSLTAVPAAAGIPLADGKQRIAVIPGNYGLEDLPDILQKFDSTLVMKIGGAMPQLVDTLTRQGLLASATYVSDATLDSQCILKDLRHLEGQRGASYASVVVTRRDNSGILKGDAPDEE